MPEVILNCPQCQRPLRVTDELMGRPVKCPACGLIFTVPAGGSEPVLTPVPVALPTRPAEDENRDPFAYPYDEHRRRLDHVEPLDFDERPRDRGKALLMPPAICLLITGILGILGNIVNLAYNLATPVKDRIPEFYPADVRQFAEKMMTPGFIISEHAIFFLISLVMIVSGIQMLRRRMYWLAITGSFVAMINLNCLCCLPGIAIGIWSLIILFRPEVQSLFR